MPIWRLIPTDEPSADWNLSTYKGEVIVRAKDCGEARNKATAAFAIAAASEVGEATRINPWRQDVLVTCERFISSKYEEEGPTEILKPPQRGS